MQRLRSAVRSAAPALTLALAAALLVSTLGPPAPAAAQSLEVARLQLVIKRVEILDDREGPLSGKGEMEFFISIWSCPEWAPLPCLSHRDRVPFQVARGYAGFSASTGDTVTLDLVAPDEASAAHGFPVYAGHQYVIRLLMWESDDGYSGWEELGEVFHFLDTGERGLTIGTHVGRATGADGGHVGDYIVTYEIRHAPVPDLRPTQIEVHDLPGSPKKRVCTGVQNVGLADAGPFEVALRVDGVVPQGGRAVEANMASGNGRFICVEVELPAAGQHTLSTTVDEHRRVVEYDETNNVVEQTYRGTGSAPTSGQAKEEGQADLIVSAIRVNGQAPDGKDDCKEGKNTVAVVVKNAGAADAGAFVVRLAVDGDDAQVTNQTVDGLEAGQEREVRFGDVRLKRGERSLAAVIDPNRAVTESNEDNNVTRVTARCKDDD